MRRILLALAIAIAISFAFCISVSALENEELYELDALLEELPKQIEQEIELTSDGDEKSGVEKLENAVIKMSSAEQIIKKLLEAIGLQAEDILKLFFAICALLMVSGIMAKKPNNTFSASLVNKNGKNLCLCSE